MARQPDAPVVKTPDSGLDGLVTSSPVGRRLLLFVAALLALLILPSTAAGVVEIRNLDASEYPIVRLSVITGKLTEDQPSLTENGETVSSLDAKNLGRAKSVVLAIDQSKSMRGDALKDAINAARAFLEAKPVSDRIAVVSFGSEAVQLTSFSSSTIDADTALRTLSADKRTGTALYDAVGLASDALASEPLQGRVIVLLTDGSDLNSETTLFESINRATDAGVAVYSIGIESKRFSPDAVQRIADETGGTYYSASSTKALTEVYAAVADELVRTWQMEYVTTARPGDSWAIVASADGQGEGSVTLAIPEGLGTPASEPSKPSGLLPATLYRSGWGPWAFGGIVGLLILAALVLALASPRSAWLRQRLAPHVGERKSTPKTAATKAKRSIGLASLYRLTERTFGHRRSWGRIETQLARADVPLRTVEFVYLSAGLGIFGALFPAAAGASGLIILAGGVAGALLPLLVVWIKAGRRVRAFDDQLPDLLVTLSSSLKAGHSLRHGIQNIVDEGEPPASKEFQRVLAEARLGRPMDEALEDMARRVGSKDFEYVVTAIAIQREVGGSLAGLFDLVSETVRGRQQFRRKIRSLTAMGRMSAYVLIALPFFMAFAITLMNPEYMEPLYNTDTGHLLIAIGLVAMAIGAVILKKIVSFKG